MAGSGGKSNFVFKLADTDGWSAEIHDKAVWVAALQAKRYVKRAAPKGRTGNLRKGVKAYTTGPDGHKIGVVHSFAPHTHLVRFGTKAHITPTKHSKALTFSPHGGKSKSSSAVVFTNHQHHPGSKGRDFVEIGLDQATPQIPIAIEGMIEKMRLKEETKTTVKG